MTVSHIPSMVGRARACRQRPPRSSAGAPSPARAALGNTGRTEPGTAAPVTFAYGQRGLAMSRRDSLLMLSVVGVGTPSGAKAAERTTQEFEYSGSGFRLLVPPPWQASSKAGAAAYFVLPGSSSTNVGVTVAPVRVATIADFGTLDSVAEKLLQAERKKDGMLDVRLLSQRSRVPHGSAALYDFEYEAYSTRGRKRILATVTISRSRLYIVNGQHKCSKELCSEDDVAQVDLVRQVTSSLRLLDN